MKGLRDLKNDHWAPNYSEGLYAPTHPTEWVLEDDIRRMRAIKVGVSKEQELEIKRSVKQVVCRVRTKTNENQKWRKVCCSEVTCKLMKEFCIVCIV